MESTKSKNGHGLMEKYDWELFQILAENVAKSANLIAKKSQHNKNTSFITSHLPELTLVILRVHCEQWLAFKMRVRYGISIFPLLTSSKKAFSRYEAKNAF